MGAGSGGFFMFYCGGDKAHLREVMAGEGLTELRFRLDMRGSTVIANL